ncbi:MAG: alpha-L-fucosidase [Clostridia bacterium]|nr:alpha-L-fucosidase [Clostridia bacterium]
MYPEFQYDKALVKCHPSARQLHLAGMEFYAFICFNMNTFTDREWGDGKESPVLFNPTEYDPRQWIDAIASAGMKGVILVCKHHDGFCIWPSAHTEHCVRNSPFQNGQGDVVRDVADACREKGLEFGVYLSPWDRNAPMYGQGKAYDDYFCAQLTELLIGYGDIFSVWFDGACGEGPNGKVQVYDWDRYYALIRKLQPGACISVSGPDVRWCGNEAGDTRESEWSVLPTGFDTPEEVAAKSQQTDDTAFREKKIGDMERDLGSRSFLEGAKGLRWRPAETDTSIRPGWFYHSHEDDKVRSTETLLDIWYRTVGGNCTLLLNIPPDRRGLLHETDVRRLREMGEHIRSVFAVNLTEKAEITADRDDGYHTAEALRTDSYDAYYKPFDGENTVSLTFRWHSPQQISCIRIKEHIPMSQRVEKYVMEARLPDDTWTTIASGTTIGYQKLERVNVCTNAVRIRITDARVCPVLSFVGIY